MDGPRPARTRLAAHGQAVKAHASGWRDLRERAAGDSPTPFERGMPPRRRGRIPETSGESIFQSIALARTFYARRRRRRARDAGSAAKQLGGGPEEDAHIIVSDH